MYQNDYIKTIKVNKERESDIIRIIRGRVTHVFFIADKPLLDTSFIKVKYIGEQSDHITIDDINIRMLSAIQDKEMGTTANSLYNNGTSLAKRSRFVYAVDLGSVNLTGSKEIEITYDFSSEEDNVKVNVVSCCLGIKPFYLNCYNTSVDTEQRRKNVKSLYVSSAKKGIELVDDEAKDIKLRIATDFGVETNCSIYDSFMVDSCVSRQELVGDRTVARVFGSNVAGGEGVYTRIQGLDTSDIELIVHSFYVDVDEVRESTVINLEEVAEKTEKLEREEPQRQKAMRSLTGEGKARDLKTVAVAVREKMASKIEKRKDL